jgi:hypothetical protein
MTQPDETQPGGRPPPRTEPPGDQTQPRLRRPDPPPSSTLHVGGSVGGDVVGRDLHKTTTAGRDVVGGDVVTTTTTNIGFPIAAVQRLVITVGVLVFVTAFCFFSSGFVLGGAALVALNRNVASSPEAAVLFADQLAALQQLAPGETATFSFTEEEISSYFRFILAPSLGDLQITDGKVRLLGDDRLVVGGQAEGLGNLDFAATFRVTDQAGSPLDLQAAVVQVLPTRNTPFGWVYVPTFALGGVEQSLNALFENVQILDTQATPNGDGWTVTVRGY